MYHISIDKIARPKLRSTKPVGSKKALCALLCRLAWLKSRRLTNAVGSTDLRTTSLTTIPSSIFGQQVTSSSSLSFQPLPSHRIVGHGQTRASSLRWLLRQEYLSLLRFETSLHRNNARDRLVIELATQYAQYIPDSSFPEGLLSGVLEGDRKPHEVVFGRRSTTAVVVFVTAPKHQTGNSS